MVILKSIGLWVIKFILGSIFDSIASRRIIEEQQQKESALLYARSVEEAAKLEVDVVKVTQKVDKEFKDRQSSTNDPFGVATWNKE